MTLDEYSNYYMSFVVLALGSSVDRAARQLPDVDRNTGVESDYKNKMSGLIVLLLVSVIEANFLSKQDFNKLRNFSQPDCSLPAGADLNEISSFIYIRDCFAHDPTGSIFDSGDNTIAFKDEILKGAFPYASISNGKLVVRPDATHQLHLTVRRFFGVTPRISLNLAQEEV
jgi:hypothetical protein